MAIMVQAKPEVAPRRKFDRVAYQREVSRKWRARWSARIRELEAEVVRLRRENAALKDRPA